MTIDSDTITNFTALVYAGAIWYLTLADYTRAAIGQPLADAVYRQVRRHLTRVDNEPERVAEIVAHVQERIAA